MHTLSSTVLHVPNTADQPEVQAALWSQGCEASWSYINAAQRQGHAPELSSGVELRACSSVELHLARALCHCLPLYPCGYMPPTTDLAQDPVVQIWPALLSEFDTSDLDNEVK